MKYKRICPRCHNQYDKVPSISRRDGKTPICPKCGVTEALEAYFGEKYEGPVYWEEEGDC